MILASNHFSTSFLITSFIVRFNLCWALIDDLLPSSSNIWCMHIEGHIPLISTGVHPMTLLCSFNILNNFSSSTLKREDEMIIGSVDEGLRYAYRKCADSGFCYILGAFSIYGNG